MQKKILKNYDKICKMMYILRHENMVCLSGILASMEEILRELEQRQKD